MSPLKTKLKLKIKNKCTKNIHNHNHSTNQLTTQCTMYTENIVKIVQNRTNMFELNAKYQIDQNETKCESKNRMKKKKLDS